MGAAATQHTLADYDLVPSTDLQTDPPDYLHTNDPLPSRPALLFDPPIPEPVPHAVPLTTNDPPPTNQLSIPEAIDGVCRYCFARPHNLSEHVLTAHPTIVNDRLAELKADRATQQTENENRDTTGSDSERESLTRDEPTPAMFGEIEADTPGQRIGDFTDPRECNDCGTTMSKSYARIFARETGEMWCPDCRSRSERYSMDDIYGEDSHSDPSAVTGQSNANADSMD